MATFSVTPGKSGSMASLWPSGPSDIAAILSFTSSVYWIQLQNGTFLRFNGSGFTFAAEASPPSPLTGVYTSIQITDGLGNVNAVLNGFGSPPATNILSNPATSVLGDADVATGSFFSDTLIGFAGNDTLHGGGGTDTADYSAATTTVVLHLDTPTKYASGAASIVDTDILTSIENLTGGSGNDYLYGDSGANVLTANDGNDYISAGAGNDSIDAGAGQDWVDASYGDDTILGGFGNDTVYGGANNDTIIGGEGNDYLHGAHGADTIQGGNGTDVLFVDSTDVFYDGGAGIDYIVWEDVAVAANINLAAHSADYAYGYNGNDIFYATGATARIELHGGDGNDILVGGGSGGAIMLGDGGNDRLVAEIGADFMVGGAGADTFVFSTRRPNNDFIVYDYIYDFQSGTDKIDLTYFSITGLNGLNFYGAFDNWFYYSYGEGIFGVYKAGGGAPPLQPGDFV